MQQGMWRILCREVDDCVGTSMRSPFKMDAVNNRVGRRVIHAGSTGRHAPRQEDVPETYRATQHNPLERLADGEGLRHGGDSVAVNRQHSVVLHPAQGPVERLVRQSQLRGPSLTRLGQCDHAIDTL